MKISVICSPIHLRTNRSADRFSVSILLILLVCAVTSCKAPSIRPAVTTYDFCKLDDDLSKPEQIRGPNDDEQVTEIKVWGLAPAQDCWNVLSLVEAAKRVEEFYVDVQPTSYGVQEGAFVSEVNQAAADGLAPDIVTGLGSGQLISMAKQGYVEPLSDCLSRHPEFNQVFNEIWETVRWNGQIWGIPLHITLLPIFYNKNKLRELGWDEAQIEQLPKQIEQGHFTLDDMADVAEEAVSLGVVEHGFGFWPHTSHIRTFRQTYSAYGGRRWDQPSQRLVINRAALEQAFQYRQRLFATDITPPSFGGGDKNSWLDRNLWRETEGKGRVLFWHAYGNHWAHWAVNHTAELGGEAHLLDNFGVTLFPSGIRGRPASVAIFKGRFHGILSKSATDREAYDAACALLAKATTPEIQAKVIRHSAEFPILKNMHSYEGFAEDGYSNQMYPMWPFVKFEPYHYSEFSSLHPTHDALFQIILDHRLLLDSGTLTPEAAADKVIQRVKREFGDLILIE